MKKLALIGVVCVLILLVFSSCNKKEETGYNVCVSKIIPHAALDAVEKGMQTYLETTDLEINYNYQTANGDVATAVSIAQQFKDSNCDISVGIGTPSAQALANVFKDKNVIYSAITDPVGAGLTADNVCGVSDANPVAAQIQLFAETTGAKTIGNIYASGEANGVTLKDQAKAACEELGLGFEEVSIANSSEVKMAAQSLIKKVDGIYIATDNAVISAIASVADVCTKENKPLFVADPSNVEALDFLMAWGFNYYNIGVETGKIVEQCLKGTSPKDIGIVKLTDPTQFELWLNEDNAEKLGITFSKDLLDSATVIIKDGNKISK